jgi:predicted transcriptional regulator
MKLSEGHAPDFAESLKQLRIARNLTRLALSQKADIVASCITQYEKGQRKPSRRVWTKLDEILSDTKEINPTNLQTVSLEALCKELQRRGCKSLTLTF